MSHLAKCRKSFPGNVIYAVLRGFPAILHPKYTPNTPGGVLHTFRMSVQKMRTFLTVSVIILSNGVHV